MEKELQEKYFNMIRQAIWTSSEHDGKEKNIADSLYHIGKSLRKISSSLDDIGEQLYQMNERSEYSEDKDND